MTLKNGREKIF